MDVAKFYCIWTLLIAFVMNVMLPKKGIPPDRLTWETFVGLLLALCLNMTVTYILCTRDRR